jgi:hypothetical protein
MYIHLSNNKFYYLNIDNIAKYCSGSDDSNKVTQSDITELYRYEDRMGLELTQKQINTTNINNGQLKTVNTYKYDMIKGLLEVLFKMGIHVMGNGMTTKDIDIEDKISIGESIAWNTMINYGFLEEVVLTESD